MTTSNTLIAGAIAFAIVSIVYLFRRRRRKQVSRQLQAQLARLEALRASSYAISHSQLDPLVLARLLSAEASNIIDIHNFQIGIFKGPLFEILFWNRDGVEQAVPQQLDRIPNSQSINWVRQNRGQINISDLTKPPKGIPTPSHTFSNKFPLSILYIPLLSGDHVIGVLISENPNRNYFDTRDIDHLEIIANQVAAAIDNGQLLEEERLLAKDLETVSSIARQVNMLTDIDKISEQVVTFARDQLQFHPVIISSVDEETGESINRQSSFRELEPGELRSMPGEGLIGSALLKRETILVNDVLSDDRYIPGIGLEGYEEVAERTRSEIVIPLLVRDRLLGLLDVQSERPGGFSNREVRVLEALGQGVAAAFDNARQLDGQRAQAWLASAQFNLARTFTEHSERETMVPAALGLIGMLLGLEASAVYQWQPDQQRYQPLAFAGLDSAETERLLSFPIEEGDWGTAAAVRLSNESRPGQLPGFNEDTAAKRFTIYPLATGRTFVGLLCCHPREHHLPINFLPYRLELEKGIRRQFARNIEKAWLSRAREEEAWANTALLQVSQTMNDLTDLNKILETIVRLVPVLIGLRSCFIFTINDDEISAGPSYGLNVAAQELLAEIADNELDERLTLSESQYEERTELTLYSADLPEEFRQALGEQSIRLLPLHARNTLVGMLAVGDTLDGKPLDGRRLNILAGIAQQAASAVVNDHLYRESAETERLQNDLGIALELQATLLPDGDPQIPGLAIASFWEAAYQISGDFYDFLKLADGQRGIVIADVAGKGIPAALYMALARTVIRAVGSSRTDPLDTLKRTNELLIQDARANLFLTAFYAVWDGKSGTFTFTNGGHNPPLLLRHDGSIEEVGSYGVALGIIDDVPLARDSVSLAIGDTLLMFTDGITEAMNAQLKPYGLPRLKATLEKAIGKSPDEIVNAIRNDVMVYINGMMQSDDVTMVVMTRTEGV